MNKKKLITLLLVIVIVVSGLLLLKKRKADLALAAPAMILPAVVATETLQPGPVLLTLPAMGVVASDVSAVLSTKVSGQVTDIYKQEGASIKKGDVLARIDVKDLEAKKNGLSLQRQGMAFQIESKKAEAISLETSLKSAADSHQRTKELLDIKGASVEQYSQEEAELARIRSNLTGARNSIETLQKSMETIGASMHEIDSLMDYATLASPIDGTVSQILVRPGDLATPGKPLVRISSKTGLYLNLSLPDTFRANEVMVKDQVFPLTSRDQAGETGLVQYVAPLPQNMGLVERQFVNVRVIVYKADSVLLPVDALLTMNGDASVFVLEPDGKTARRMTVHIIHRGIEGVAVSENLGGQTVIVAKPDILLRVSAGVPIVQIKG